MTEFQLPTIIGVAIVDDQTLFRAGLRMLIQSQDDMRFLGEAEDGETAMTLAKEVRPDIMLMDVRMPIPPRTQERQVTFDPPQATGRT
ncbi:response regulator transcription factor [Arthrobacter sp. ZGTC212]|uniref:response regulator n=1 Tax=Arthrobacter sp. ZGTC212 TaxID=2058899 RepID=UPI000CE3C244|nr:response regulator transcription factor [Arthrobacter sp. ZGTC212]